MNNHEIRELQDKEYNESLKIDKKKSLEKLEMQYRVDKKKLAKDKLLMEKKNRLKIQKSGQIIKLRFKLGQKTLTEEFTDECTLMDIHDFVFIQDIGEKFEINTYYQSTNIPYSDQKIIDFGIKDRTVLFVNFLDN